jgi:hypothetical protein
VILAFPRFGHVQCADCGRSYYRSDVYSKGKFLPRLTDKFLKRRERRASLLVQAGFAPKSIRQCWVCRECLDEARNPVQFNFPAGRPVRDFDFDLTADPADLNDAA